MLDSKPCQAIKADGIICERTATQQRLGWNSNLDLCWHHALAYDEHLLDSPEAAMHRVETGKKLSQEDKAA